MERHQRPPNITDALRALGALCVIWYHNPIYWTLDDTAGVDLAKFVLLGWSMPFFYATSARFAFTPPSRKSWQRVLQLLKLVVGYFVLYEALAYLSGRGAVWTCLHGSAPCRPDAILMAIRTVSGTPSYYLSDVIVLVALGAGLVGLAERLGRLATYAVIALGFVAMLFADPYLWGLFLNPLALGCFVWSAVWWVTIGARVGTRLKPERTRAYGAPTTAFVLIAWGVLNALFAQNVYWSGISNILIFGLLLQVILSFDFFLSVRALTFRKLSEWGQRYSLGLLLLHQLWFDIAASRFAALFVATGIPSTSVFILIGGLVTVLTVVTAVLLERFWPASVSLHSGRAPALTRTA